MNERSSLLSVLAFTACASTPTPDPQERSQGQTAHVASSAPVVSSTASASAEIAPSSPPPATAAPSVATAPASVPPAASSAPVATPPLAEACAELVNLCHDVGHDGGVTGKCHNLGHARNGQTCVTEFAACKLACEAATKAAQTTGKKKHAH